MGGFCMSRVLTLGENLFIGNGAHRKVYVHPENPRRCIKITYTDIGQMTEERELKYLRILKRRHKQLGILPTYFGQVETNLGIGYVYERVVDYDGGSSLSIASVADDETWFRSLQSMFAEKLQYLHAQLLENEIVSMALEMQNIMFPQIAPGQYDVKLVNDIGSPVAIPLEYYFSFFARQKVERRWRQFQGFLRKDPRTWVRELADMV